MTKRNGAKYPATQKIPWKQISVYLTNKHQTNQQPNLKMKYKKT